jgi:hypothetical protein
MAKVARIDQSILYLYFIFNNNNKMIEEEEMEKLLGDDRYDECAYVKDDDDLCA